MSRAIVAKVMGKGLPTDGPRRPQQYDFWYWKGTRYDDEVGIAAARALALERVLDPHVGVPALEAKGARLLLLDDAEDDRTRPLGYRRLEDLRPWYRAEVARRAGVSQSLPPEERMREQDARILALRGEVAYLREKLDAYAREYGDKAGKRDAFRAIRVRQGEFAGDVSFGSKSELDAYARGFRQGACAADPSTGVYSQADIPGLDLGSWAGQRVAVLLRRHQIFGDGRKAGSEED